MSRSDASWEPSRGQKKNNNNNEYGFKNSGAQVGGAQGDFRCDKAFTVCVALV